MPKIWIGTSITENYIDRAIPFLHSLKMMHDNTFCVCYGFKPTLLKKVFKNINFYFLDRNCVEIEGMIQWGTWLRALTYTNDDVYIISDADMVIQRRLHKNEINRFFRYDNNTVGVAPNMGKNDFLYYEAVAIALRDGFEYNKKAPIFNCGVMTARPKFFESLTVNMERLIPQFNKYSDHRSRCQFLMCHIFDIFNVNVDMLSREFHSNGHGGIPPGCKFVGPTPDGMPMKTLLHDNKKVMFKHHFEDVENKIKKGT